MSEGFNAAQRELEILDLRKANQILHALIGNRDEEIARLRKGIQDYLDGNYNHPRSYRVHGANATCPHGHYYYEECCSCNEEHFSRLLGETYTNPPAHSSAVEKTEASQS